MISGILGTRNLVPPYNLALAFNPGKIFLTLIEVQSGSYVGEDDIVRFDDKYGRLEK